MSDSRIIGADRIEISILEVNLITGELMRDALRRASCSFSVTNFTSDWRIALERAELNAPDVSLISVNLKDGPLAGLCLLRRLMALSPEIRCVMLSDHLAPDLVMDAFRQGARGVFSRNDSWEALCTCIRAVSEGQVWAKSDELSHVLHAFVQAVPLRVVSATGENLLTEREQEITFLVADGLTNREIARHLNLSENTVRNYIFRIFNKLGISSRVELVLYCLNERNQKGKKKVERQAV